MVENGAEDCEFVGFVVFPVDDKELVQGLFEPLNL